MKLFVVVGTAMGWGDTTNRSTLATKLQEIEVELVTLETCQRVYGWFERKAQNRVMNGSFVVTDSMICARGEGGPSVCDGDSGE